MKTRAIGGYRRWLVATLISALVAATLIPIVPANAAGEFEATLSLVAGGSVPKGGSFRFLLEVRNATQETRTADLKLLVGPTGGTPVAFDGVKELMAGGQALQREFTVRTGQWFASGGPFEITTQANGYEAEPLVFEVAASPVRVPKFKDVTEVAGIATTLPNYRCPTWSAGAAWGDADGDKDLDLFVPRSGSPSQLWINDGGTFTDEALDRGVEASGSESLGAVFADYDNDGDQDLYVNADGPNLFFKNDGSGHFQEGAALAGVAEPGPSQSASWGDYDNDGRLDLYVTNHSRCEGGTRVYYDDALFHQGSNGRFTDASSLLPRPESWTHDGAGFQTSFVDYDLDGDVDIYLANDFLGADPRPNVLWRNDGATGFTDVSSTSGAGVEMNSMGIGVLDLDRDLDFDFAISNIDAPKLLRQDPKGTFTDIAGAAGIARDLQSPESRAVTWGTVAEDFNNDGWVDLYFAAGRLGSAAYQPNQMFTNAHDGTFLDHSAPSRADDLGVSRGIAVADYDRDGRLDLFVVNQDGTPRLYRNVTKRKDAHWLEVDTRGRVSTKDGCGGLVIARLKGAKLVRQVFCGGTSLGSGSDSTVHFGLGSRSRVRKLVVKWPSGTKTVRRGLKTDRSIRVREPKPQAVP